MFMQLIICTSTLIKALYFNGDNEILLRFPVSGDDIFFAKSAYVFVNSLVISVALLLPIYISYGIFTGANGFFFIWAMIVTAFGSVLPFLIANIIAIPVMYLVNLIKDKYLLVLLIMIAVVVGAFSLYMTVLKQILVYIQTQELSLFTPEMVSILDKFVVWAIPAKFYANMLCAKDLFASFSISFLINLAAVSLAAFVVKKWYFKTILKSIETGKSSFTKVTKSKRLPVFINLVNKEFLLVFRNLNYSFQYLCMAVAAPFMVFYCNDIAAALGKQTIGDRLLPGLTLLVVTIFITVIVSFSSTAISREGHNLYHTKNMPVTFAKQLFSKFTFYGAVAFLSVCVSCTVVVCAKYVGLLDGLFIWLIAELVVVMQTAIAMLADLKSPVFNVMGDGDVTSANKNMSISIIVGLVLACVYGISAMILSYLPISIGGIEILNGDVNRVYFILLGITAICAGISVFALFFKANKRYMKIVG
jgi:ABC-2 type transport system permease protein